MMLRMPILWAIEVRRFPKCADPFRSKSVFPTDWAGESKAYHVFDFHIIVALQTVLPFFVLILLNAVIIQRLLVEKKNEMYAAIQPTLYKVGEAAKKASTAKAEYEQVAIMPENYLLLEVATELIKESLITKSSRGKRAQLRNAIYTMLAIVTSYLICNGLHLILTILERFGSSLLLEAEDDMLSTSFYILLSDTVSIAYLLTSAIRIFIYAKCNPKLRKDIKDFLMNRRRV
ncbi:unnamed protein product, partial [Mesorhabditis spiculigera]